MPTTSPLLSTKEPAAGWAGPRLVDILAPEANNFGLLRVLLAVAVLVSHAYYLRSGSPLDEPIALWTGHSLGEHAVQVFFFLSGLMVAQSLDRQQSVWSFARARALRIFPGLCVCILLTALVLGPLVTRLPLTDYLSDPRLVQYVARTLTLSTGMAPLPGVFEALPAASAVNISLWTLKYEVFCYGVLAIVGVLGLMRPHWRQNVGLLLAGFVAVIFLESPDPVAGYDATQNVRYFTLFFATGVMSYLLRHELRVNAVGIVVLGAVFLLARGTHLFELASALFLGYAALALACLPVGRLRALANRYDLSFGVYIYACPLQQLIVQEYPAATVGVQILLALALVLPLALASWLFVERPALRLARRSNATLPRAPRQPLSKPARANAR